MSNKRLLVLVILIVCTCCVVVALFFKSNNLLKLANLAQVPRNATEVHFYDSGTIFAPEFHGHFKAAQKDVEQWKTSSPGFKDALCVPASADSVHVTSKSGVSFLVKPHTGTKYIILNTKPGVSYAEVEISPGMDEVSMYLYLR